MRRVLLAVCVVFALTGSALADEFPGPVVKNSAPFNSKNVMLGSNIPCPKTYTAQQMAVGRSQIVADVKQCITRSFGITKDIGLDFGSGDHADCVVPEEYDARPPANNPMWPVCCMIPGAADSYRMVCRLYFTQR